MNRKQWLVLGIGLILYGFILHNSLISAVADCLANIEVKAPDPNATAEIISCSEMYTYLGAIDTLAFTLGVIFVILGFLEPKKP